MPSGGLSMFGGGLQLQQATPGTQSIGNFNISGAGLGGNFSTANGVNGGPEKMGHGFTGAVPSNLVCFGNNNNTAANTGVGPIALFGYQCQATGQANVALGIGNQAGPIPATGFANNVALGNACLAGTSATDGGNRVAMGYSCTASGDTNVAIGRGVSALNTKAGNGDIIAMGANITPSLGAQKAQYFGDGIGATAGINVTVVGGWGAGGGAPAWPGVASNTVMLGNANQTNIFIGSLNLTKQTVAGAKGGNVALGNLLAALVAMNLINDTTTP